MFPHSAWDSVSHLLFVLQGPYTCAGCLDGILGARTLTEELCNATLGDAETLFTVAPKYNTDWMALWSLNGWEAPDVAHTGSRYRCELLSVCERERTLLIAECCGAPMGGKRMTLQR